MEAPSTASDNNYLKSNSLSGQCWKWEVSSLRVDGGGLEEGESGAETVIISISAQGITKHFCSPMQGKASTHPTIIRLRKHTGGRQTAPIKAAQAAVPTQGVPCLQHGAFGHIPEAADWKGLTCYLQSILAYSVRPTSAGSLGKAEPLLSVYQGGVGSVLPVRVSGRGWQ